MHMKKTKWKLLKTDNESFTDLQTEAKSVGMFCAVSEITTESEIPLA